jgi:hypothetical protein
MSRQIDQEAFAHAADTRSQRFFYFVGMAVAALVLVLVLHTFEFWGWFVD